MRKAFASIERGLRRGSRHRKAKRGAGMNVRVPRPVEVKALREKIGLRLPRRRVAAEEGAASGIAAKPESRTKERARVRPRCRQRQNDRGRPSTCSAR